MMLVWLDAKIVWSECGNPTKYFLNRQILIWEFLWWEIGILQFSGDDDVGVLHILAADAEKFDIEDKQTYG